MPRPSRLELTEEQVLCFRARRSHLAGTGARSPLAAARAILGAQSQQLSSSLLALSLRTRGQPTAARLQSLLFRSPRRLVRTDAAVLDDARRGVVVEAADTEDVHGQNCRRWSAGSIDAWGSQ